MLSMIFYTLAVSSFMVNNINYTSDLTPITYQQGVVLRYELDANESDVTMRNGDIVSFGTPLGSISFEIETTFYIRADSAIDFKFKVAGESVNTNLYLTDLHVHVTDAQGFTGMDSYLPDIYFLGQSVYYEDNESGNFTIDTGLPTLSPDFYLDFTISTTNPRFVDGSGYQQGYADGWNSGNDYGFEDGYTNGYNTGYADGFNTGSDLDTTTTSIFAGIIEVGMLPVNFFLSILNFEVFGINIGAFVTALLTIAIVVYVIRIVKGSGSHD